MLIISGAACKEKWKNLRAVYVRHMKAAPSGAKKKKYYLTEAMNFILPYVKPHVKASGDNHDDDDDGCGNDNVKEDVYHASSSKEKSDKKEDIVSEITEEMPPQSVNQSCTKIDINSKRHAPKEVDRPFTYIPREDQLAHRSNRDETRRYFLLSLLDEVNKMTEEQMRVFKRKVFVLIDDIMTLPTTDIIHYQYHLHPGNPVSESSARTN